MRVTVRAQVCVRFRMDAAAAFTGGGVCKRAHASVRNAHTYDRYLESSGGIKGVNQQYRHLAACNSHVAFVSVFFCALKQLREI
jgi:hypothetical protein